MSVVCGFGIIITLIILYSVYEDDIIEAYRIMEEDDDEDEEM